MFEGVLSLSCMHRLIADFVCLMFVGAVELSQRMAVYESGRTQPEPDTGC
jgi:hypothetical protein